MFQEQPHSSTESTSLDSAHHHTRSWLALTLATLIAAIGLTASLAGASATENSSTPEPATSHSPDARFALVGMPTPMKAKALTSTTAENNRQVRLNRVAKKKHEVRVVRNKIVKTARAQLGDSYRAGHSGPHAFDCSGLVRYVFQEVTGKTLPHYSKAQYKHARKIKKSEAQPGDLVFFFEKGAHHVGIYIGNGKMIDAPRVGEKVRISPISGSWWGRSYTGMGSVLPA